MICYVFRRGKNYSGKLRLDNESRTSIIALGTPDKRIAQAKLFEVAKEREKELLGLLPPKSAREAAGKPLAELLAIFLQDVEAKGRAKHTLAKYRCSLPKLFARCGWQTLRQVNVRSFCEWRAGCGLSPKTLNDALMNARTFFRWLVYQRLAVENPLDHVQLVDNRLARQYRRAFSQVEAPGAAQSRPIQSGDCVFGGAFNGVATE